MNFVTGLPKSSHGHDAIWVIVDHSQSLRTSYSFE